jgi:hypothetical protein
MRAEVKEVEPLSDGYAFRFQADQSTILLVSELLRASVSAAPSSDLT